MAKGAQPMHGYYENHRDDMTQARAWHVSNDHCAPHFHHSIELVYVMEGTLVATLDAREYAVDAGRMIITSGYTVHRYETPASSQSIIAIIPAAFVPTLRLTLSRQVFAGHVCPDDKEGTLGLLMRMMVEAEDDPITMKGLCYTVLGLLIRRVGMTEARASDRVAFIRDVLAYLNQHHTESLSAEQVAAHFGYSRSRFSRIFNDQLGCSLTQYIGSLRCQHAAQLLRETDMAVSDIAMAVGFESLRTFYRTFKKQYEMTPNRYAGT